MNNEIKLGAVLISAFLSLFLFFMAGIMTICFVQEEAENNYLKQQIETQKELIKELKEGK